MKGLQLKIARNFFGSVPSFFLKDQEFTSIKSALNTQTFNFKGNEVYMMRVKMHRSSRGPRTYEFEIDSIGQTNRLYTNGGGTALKPKEKNDFSNITSGWPNFATGANDADRYYPLPQDPRFNPNFRETFTMYSRPTAFGPPVSGRPSGSSVTATPIDGRRNDNPGQPAAYSTASLDSFSGFNPAFTPPYYNGEAWCVLH